MSDEVFNNEAQKQVNRLHRLSVDFDSLCQERHEMGAEKYGNLNFMETDTIEMAIEEIADMANYLRYTYIKLRMLQDFVVKKVEEEPTPMLGVEGWKKD